MMFFRGVCVVLFAMTLQEALTESNYDITVKGLVSCILQSMKGDADIPDGAVEKVEKMMMKGYGCYCRLGGGDNPAANPLDDIDRVCKEYIDCLGGFKDHYDLEEIPVREYEFSSTDSTKTCTDLTQSLCDQKHSGTSKEDQCNKDICKVCDIDKINSLKSAIKRVVSDKSQYANSWYWNA